MPTIDVREDRSVWLEWPTEGFVVRARVAQTVDDRFHFGELHVDAIAHKHLVTSDTLRAVPITRMLSWANGDGREQLIEAFDPVRRIVGSVEARRLRRKPPLRFPDVTQKRKPDAFYIKVAAAYTWLFDEGSRRPAQDLAEANGVPATTAHRWIREARRRGFLPPGETGRAGTRAGRGLIQEDQA